MKKALLIASFLLTSFLTLAHDSKFLECKGGRLYFYTHVGDEHTNNRFLTITYVDKQGNPLTGDCAKASLKVPIKNGEAYFDILPNTCLKSDGKLKYSYTRIKIVCSKGDYSDFETVENTNTCKASLPLTLENFEGERDESTITLNWRTSEEVNFSHFEVMGSADTKEWFSIYTTYEKSAVLETPLKYFKLKMIDLDNTFTYSNIIVLEDSPLKEISYLTLSGLKVTPIQGLYIQKKEYTNGLITYKKIIF